MRGMRVTGSTFETANLRDLPQAVQPLALARLQQGFFESKGSIDRLAKLASLKQEMQTALGLSEADFDTHESDLYVRATPEVEQWLKENYLFHSNIEPFISQIDNKRWLDIPFGYMDEFISRKRNRVGPAVEPALASVVAASGKAVGTRFSFLNTPEDMQWLKDVYGLTGQSAVLYGNEDWPDEIQVFDVVEPLVDTPYRTYRLDENGKAVEAPDAKQASKKTATMYGDVINGRFDLTYEDMLQQVRDNPVFTSPDDVCFVGDDGTEYTGKDLLALVGLENQLDKYTSKKKTACGPEVALAIIEMPELTVKDLADMFGINIDEAQHIITNLAPQARENGQDWLIQQVTEYLGSPLGVQRQADKETPTETKSVSLDGYVYRIKGIDSTHVEMTIDDGSDRSGMALHVAQIEPKELSDAIYQWLGTGEDKFSGGKYFRTKYVTPRRGSASSSKTSAIYDGYATRLTIETRAGDTNESYTSVLGMLAGADIRYREVRRYTIDPDRVCMDVLVKADDLEVIKELAKEAEKDGIVISFNDNISEALKPKQIVTPEKEVTEDLPKAKTAAKTKLPSEKNTPEIQQQVLDAFWSSEFRKEVERPNAVFEHGHWWITGIDAEGDVRQWDAVDAEGPGSVDGFGFEAVASKAAAKQAAKAVKAGESEWYEEDDGRWTNDRTGYSIEPLPEGFGDKFDIEDPQAEVVEHAQTLKDAMAQTDRLAAGKTSAKTAGRPRTVTTKPEIQSHGLDSFLNEMTDKQQSVVERMLAGEEYDSITANMTPGYEARFYEGLARDLGMFDQVNEYDNRPFGEFLTAIENRVKEVLEFPTEPAAKTAAPKKKKAPAKPKARMLKDREGLDTDFDAMLRGVRPWQVFEQQDDYDVQTAVKVLKSGDVDEGIMDYIADQGYEGAKYLFDENNLERDDYEDEFLELEGAIQDKADYNYHSVMPEVFFTDPQEFEVVAESGVSSTEDESYPEFVEYAKKFGFTEAQAKEVYVNASYGGMAGVGVIANAAEALTGSVSGSAILYVRDSLNGSGMYVISGSRAIEGDTNVLADLIDYGSMSLGEVFGTGDWRYR